MQQNNCLVLNNSLHLYPSSLRRRAELTLSSVRKGEKLSGVGRAGGSSRTPPSAHFAPGPQAVWLYHRGTHVNPVPSRTLLSFSACAAAWGDSSPGKGLFLSCFSFVGFLLAHSSRSLRMMPQPSNTVPHHPQRSSLCHPPALWNNTHPRTDLCAPHLSLVSSPSPL